MTLEEVFNLKPGARFQFRGKPATVVWQDSIKEFMFYEDKEKQKPVFFRNWTMCFTYGPENKTVTLNSCYPDPKKLLMEEYKK